MAHELDFTTGQAAIALRGGAKTAWHGLGQTIEDGDSLETICIKAGLDWSALVVPAQYEFDGQLMTAPGAFHMVRSDNGKSLSVMSSRYRPVQPADIMAFFRDFVLADDRFVIETAGALKGGRVIWALAKFADSLTVNGDAHVAYVLLTTSFNGSLATTMQGTMIRVVCNNTLTASIYSADSAAIKVPHYRDFSRTDVQADVHERFTNVINGYDQYKAMAEAMAGVRLAAFQVEGLFKRLTIDKAAKGDTDKVPSGKARNQLEALLASYRDTLAEGTTGGTAWAVLNGVTRYVDHKRTSRDTEGDGPIGARMASSFFGSGAAMKREAMQVLAEIGNLKLAA